MHPAISDLRETLQRLERLLTRFELDVVSRLHPLDYSAVIAALCLDFEQQLLALAESHERDERSGRK
jgi:hypothetical protein